MNNTEICNLPDVALLRIFDFVPLRQLFRQIPAVCWRWKQLAGTAVRRRRSISIVVGRDDPLHLLRRSAFLVPFEFRDNDNNGDNNNNNNNNNNKPNIIAYRRNDISQLHFSDFENLPPLVEILNEFCAQIESLEFVHRNIDYRAGLRSIDRFIDRCNHLCNNLRVVRCWLSYDNDNEDVAAQRTIASSICALLRRIFALRSLRHLTVYCRHQLLSGVDYHRGDKVDLAVDLAAMLAVDRLRSLQWYSFDSAEMLINGETDQRFSTAPSSSIAQIELGNLINQNCLKQYLRFSPQFADRFTNVDISFASPTVEQLNDFVRLFRHLTTIYIYVENIDFVDMARSLESLDELQHLRVDINFEFYRFTNRAKLETEKEAMINVDVKEKPKLCALKILSLRVITITHDDLNLLSPEQLFPALAAIQIVNLNEHCAERGCEYVYPRIRAEQRRDCTKRLLRPFRRCPRLIRAYALKSFNDDGQYHWDAEQL